MAVTFTTKAKKSIWALSILTLSCGLAGCGGAVYEAELEFLEDVPPPAASMFVTGGKGKKVEIKGVAPFVIGPKGKKGEVKKERGWLTFEETEKGWRGPDKNVY